MTASRKRITGDKKQEQQGTHLDPELTPKESGDDSCTDQNEDVQKDEFSSSNSPGDQNEYGYEEFTR